MTHSLTPEDRLAERGWPLPAVAAPIAAYVPAVRIGGQVITSGQLPLREGQRLLHVGKVGAGVSLEQAVDCARQCTLNALAAIRAEIDDLAAIVRIVRVVVYVASAPDFCQQPTVANGASELLVDVFGERGRHARSAVGVAALPLDAPVEVELQVAL